MRQCLIGGCMQIVCSIQLAMIEMEDDTTSTQATTTTKTSALARYRFVRSSGMVSISHYKWNTANGVNNVYCIDSSIVSRIVALRNGKKMQSIDLSQ